MARKQLTIRFDKELGARIRDLSRRDGISQNQAVLKLLRQATGLEPSSREIAIGNSLDRFIGTWSEEETGQVMEAVKDFEVLDDSVWR
jgi:hypothetical protein